MGYETYNLYGTGFGTNLALTVMRDFPEDIRAVVLDGVWPPQVTAAEARRTNAASALEALFRRCEADPDCSRRYPDLEQDLWEVVDRYETRPTTTWRSDQDPAEHFEVKVDGPFILRRVVASLRSHSWIPYVPFLLHRIAGGDWHVALAFISPGRSQPMLTDTPAAWASLLCHAEGNFTDPSEVLADRTAHPRMVDTDAPDLVPALCAAWRDPTDDPADRAPTVSDIPTLLLSGEFDPDTPASWADLAAETLTRSHSIVVPMAGHGVGVHTPCGRRLTGAFLNAPGTDPSPACFQAAAPTRSGFRTILLKEPRAPISFRWYDRTLLNELLSLAVLLILMLHVSALILWPVAAVIGRRGSGAEPAVRQVKHPRLTAAAVIAVSLGFAVSVGAAIEILFALSELGLPPWLPWPVFSVVERGWLTDEVVRNFGYFPWARPLFYIPYLTAAATGYVLYLALRSWLKKWWTVLGRVHYSIVAITLAWYPLQMVYLGFIP